MRRFLFLTVCMTCWALMSRAQIKWYSLEEAQQLASRDSKPIFMDFTAVWCGWCKKLDKTTFRESEVEKVLNDQFYAVKVDFDSRSPVTLGERTYDTKKDMAKSFGITGLPTMIVYDPVSGESKKIEGYRKGKTLIKDLGL